MSDKKKALPVASASVNITPADWRAHLIPHTPKPDDGQYPAGELHFLAMADAVHRNGWHFVPQERTGRRLAGRIYGSAIEWGIYAERRPTAKEVREFKAHCATLNLAIITPDDPSGPRILDIDVTDPKLSHAIQKIADRILGHTPLRRIGTAPKIALIYRGDPADPITTSMVRRLIDAETGVASSHMIEVLGPRRLLTVYGNHHATGRYFQWARGTMQPGFVGPEVAPVITAAKLQEFLDAVDAELGSHRLSGLAAEVAVSDGSEAIEGASVDASGIVVPGDRKRYKEVLWRNGFIADGAEIQATKRSFAYCLRNPRLLKSEEGLRALTQALYDEVYRDMSPNGAYRGGSAFPSSRKLMEGCRLRIRSSARTLLRKGGTAFMASLHDESGLSFGTRSAVRVGQAEANTNSLRFLPSAEMRRAIKFIARTAADPVRRARRALKADRREEAKRVSDAVRTGADAFLTLAFSKALDTPVHILQAPTGAGKTSTLIERIAFFYRQHPDYDKAVFLFMPSYGNIEEAVEKASRGKDGNTPLFRKMAEDMAREASAAGVEVMIYYGKEKGGCQEFEKLRLLQAAKIGTAGLCRSSLKDEDGKPLKNEAGEPKYRYCEHYKGCPIIAQRQRVKGRRLVILPLAFVTLDLPEEVKEAAGAAIFDERVWSELVRSATFPVDAFKQPRREPKPTKKEVEAGLTGKDMIADRERAIEIVNAARLEGTCPALALHRTRIKGYKDGAPFWIARGKAVVDSCIAISGRTRDAGKEVHPELDIDAIRLIAERPAGKWLHEEWRFWKIIRERIEQLEADELALGLRRAAARNAGLPVPEALPAVERLARGARDMRIQFLDDDAHRDAVRVSWRVEPNFSSIPTMLLDASADPEIIAKCWSPRAVHTVAIEGSLHVRVVAAIDSTFSATSMLPERAQGPEDALAAATRVHKVRRVLANASALFGHGRVIAGAMMGVRQRIMGKAVHQGETTGTWAEPLNLDFGHYGAFRGLDYAKMHMAAIAIGRLDLPARVIDGLVAAITYDDVEPELPIDVDGTGKAPGGKRLVAPEVRRAYPLRDGSDLIINVPAWPGRWAAKVQSQYREEELKQFLGRLRPVYRDGVAPVLFALGRVMPGMPVEEYKDEEGRIRFRPDYTAEASAWTLDEVMAFDDLAELRDYQEMGEIVRRVGVTDAMLAGEAVADLIDPVGHAALAAAAGLDGADRSGRFSQGMMAVRADIGGVEPMFVQMPAYVMDPEAHLRALLPEGTPVGVSVVAEPERVPSLAKKDDKIDLALGSKAERQGREAEVWTDAADRAYGELVARHGSVTERMVYAAPAGPLKDRLVPLEVRIILEQACPHHLVAPVIEAPKVATPSNDPWHKPFDQVA
ncbi:hypothetical protein [Microvirga sp. Mcv34]|uniref:hypothetical protein n=1 Tax=Microvirga sp. Mcv34 TaxID=2926016 RepID=UPI0021C96248|nr:hypothetical protein [Microvirga sp. Mcv34]